MSKPFAKITNSEPCIIMLLEKLQKTTGLWTGLLSLYLQHMFKDQPWLLWKSGETAQVSHALCSIMPLVNSTRKST